MPVYIEKESKTIALAQSCIGTTLLQQLNINPSTVILVKNNEVVLSDESLETTDDIKILSVISGG